MTLNFTKQLTTLNCDCSGVGKSSLDLILPTRKQHDNKEINLAFFMTFEIFVMASETRLFLLSITDDFCKSFLPDSFCLDQQELSILVKVVR